MFAIYLKHVYDIYVYTNTQRLCSCVLPTKSSVMRDLCSAWDRNTSAISKLGDLFSFPSSPTLVEEFQFLGTSAKGASASAKGTKPN